jgi:hypothetical protein
LFPSFLLFFSPPPLSLSLCLFPSIWSTTEAYLQTLE